MKTRRDDDHRLAVAGFVPASRANGPGQRIVLWVQGCSIGCPGCFNPSTHAPVEARRPVGEVAAQILAAVRPGTVGVTFSGGEPFEQAGALSRLARRLRDSWPEGTLMVYTGYTLEHLRSEAAPEGSADLLALVDHLVDGPFEARSPGGESWRASSNQRLWILGRPLSESVGDHTDGHVGEFHLLADGIVILSGLPDERLKKVMKAIT